MDSDIIFGIRPILEAIISGKEIEKVLIKKDLNGELFLELFKEIRNYNIPFQYVPTEKLNRITGKNHQGVIALVSSVIYYNIETILPVLYEEGQTPFILILDSITDVRNIGAIARSAECGGIHAIIIPEKGSAQLNADAIKTSAGALHHIPVCRVKNLITTAKFLKDSGLKIMAASEKASVQYFNEDYRGPVAFILGAEDTGIHPDLLPIADQLIRIPVAGKINSLNVSAAAAVIIFEAVRQRNNVQI